MRDPSKRKDEASLLLETLYSARHQTSKVRISNPVSGGQCHFDSFHYSQRGCSVCVQIGLKVCGIHFAQKSLTSMRFKCNIEQCINEKI